MTVTPVLDEPGAATARVWVFLPPAGEPALSSMEAVTMLENVQLPDYQGSWLVPFVAPANPAPAYQFEQIDCTTISLKPGEQLSLSADNAISNIAWPRNAAGKSGSTMRAVAVLPSGSAVAGQGSSTRPGAGST